MQVHILLLNGATIQMTAPEDFKLETWVQAIRIDGHLRAPNFYVTRESVAAFVLLDSDTTIQFKPMGSTLQ
jgi:hypothetical protein